MNDSEFNALADAVLAQIEQGLEDSGADLDFFLASAGVLEIEFADGSKIVVNRHGAAKEMWIAARSGGFHFRWDGAVWGDTRSGESLLEALSTLVSAQAGEPVNLT
ncbi:MAG: iron donor protein CyaY [Betaproteobacteria bacterium]